MNTEFQMKEKQQVIGFRVTPSERTGLDRDAETAGLNLTDYVRSQLIIHEISFEVTPMERAQLELEAKTCGLSLDKYVRSKIVWGMLADTLAATKA